METGDSAETGDTEVMDLDGDGFPKGEDCDDTDPEIHPKAQERCDGRDNDCDGSLDPGILVPADYKTIPQAMDVALPGELICVAAGTWTGTLDFQGKDIEIEGAGGSAGTILDGGGAGPVVRFSSGETPKALLRGFTITGGVDDWSDGAGIFIHESSPTLQDLEISGNRCVDQYSCEAAGLTIQGGAPTLSDLRVLDNECAPVRGNTSGCGIYVWEADPILERVTIAGNHASGGWESQGAEGVGLFLMGSHGSLLQVEILDNESHAVWSRGVGLTVLGGAPTFENLIVAGNLVQMSKGGWQPDSVTGTGVLTDDSTTARFTNVTVTGNRAEVVGGVSGAGWANQDGGMPELVNVTISDNTAGLAESVGVYEEGEGTVAMSWCNLWGHDLEVQGMEDPLGTVGNLRVDPGFVDVSATEATAWDLRLGPKSELIDAGDPGLVDADGSRSDVGGYGGALSEW